MNERTSIGAASILGSCVVPALLMLLSAGRAEALEPFRSFDRLVTSNGHAVASYDLASRRVDTFLEHPYRFAAPRDNPPDLCFSADESRDLAYDVYFGVRSGSGAGERGEWLPSLPIERAEHELGTGIVHVRQYAGEGRSLRVDTYTFMPMEVAAPALVMVARVENTTSAPIDAGLYGLFNFRLGLANGGREPGAEGEEVSFDAARSTMYEYGPSQGTVAYVALSPILHRTVGLGPSGAFESLRALRDLDDVGATTAPVTDVAPGVQTAEVSLAPGQTLWAAVGIVWALDEDAAPKVDLLRTWAAGATPEALLERERASWSAWHTPTPAGLDEDTARLYRHSAAMLRMGQVREAGRPHGQILASLPPGLGDLHAQWNITWVRDMAYAVVALVRAGHMDEARDALRFQLRAGPGRHEAIVGRPYRLSITRYFGNGEEESDCNADGPNIELDGFGLFLWSLGEYVRAGGDLEELRASWSIIRDEIADVLLTWIDDTGLVKADSSIWETHWNGKQRRYTYTSLAGARGLCDVAELAERLGESGDATRYRAAGARMRDAVVRLNTDTRGALAQSAEDLLRGHGYVDAAAVEAIGWGIVDPTGRVARSTLRAIEDNLRVANGMGFMRNDDGGDYDSQEWIFVDLRLVPAFRAAGRAEEADALLHWVRGQAFENFGAISELHRADSGRYAGSIPMMGFGAGAYILAVDGRVAASACGGYAPEPSAPVRDGGVDGGPVGPPPDTGCSVAPGRAAPGLAWLFVSLVALLFRVRRRRARRLGSSFALFAPLLASSLVACADEAPPAPIGAGLCRVEVSYVATSSTPRVFVAGSWNDFQEGRDELVDDGTGRYSIGLSLAPGVYPYKLVVRGDGREPWRLDPANSYRAYAAGIENSGLRVPDCSLGALEVEAASPEDVDGAGSFSATLRYDVRQGAPLAMVQGRLRSGARERALSAGELSRDGDAVRVALAALGEGKHTVHVTGTDARGRVIEDVILPFWIESEPFDWRGTAIYMAMTDRFRDGDPTNNPTTDDASDGATWAGGDLDGLRMSIEEGYFDRLGVRALWLTPFNVNPAGAYADADAVHMVSGYHGYWPSDPLGVDARLGGDAALRRMIDAAHARGIRVLMDLVVNHVHQDHPYAQQHPGWFNDGCICGEPGCDWTERRLDCLFRGYLPDVDWTSAEASERFIEDALIWMERYDLDGFRVDAVKHVVDGAVFNLGIRVRERFETAGTRVFLMGETAMGWDESAGPTQGGNPENYGTISRYIGPDGLDGQFDFVLYYAAALQLVADRPGRGMTHLDFWTHESQRRYPPGAIMTPYIGSHDTARFLSLTAEPARAGNKWSDLPSRPEVDEPYDRMYVALAWLLSLPGAPLLYYGDEYGEFGGSDPDNRHPMRFGSALSSRETRQLERVARLGVARADLRGLQSDAMETLFVDDELWAVARGRGEDGVLVVINRGGVERRVTIPVSAMIVGEGATFEDSLSPGTTLRVERGAVDLVMPPRSARYLHRTNG